ncbi:MAG: KH domain-containing protein [Candidatus Caldatribacteriota bacterium]|nr:KH domain-containing protein [Candidatus Caldatribacteriota bacterium]
MEKNTDVDSGFNLSEEAKLILKKIIDFILEDGEVEILNQGEAGIINLDIKTSDPSIIIGRHGHTLDAIQHVLNILVNRKVNANERKKIVVDAEDYRGKRKDILTKYAEEKASMVKNSNNELPLCFMNAAERRIIHVVLQEDPSVMTYSEGIEPYRKVIIAPREKEEEEKKDIEKS